MASPTNNASTIVAGISGTFLFPQITAPLVGMDVAGERLATATTLARHGFITFVPGPQGWAATNPGRRRQRDRALPAARPLDRLRAATALDNQIRGDPANTPTSDKSFRRPGPISHRKHRAAGATGSWDAFPRACVSNTEGMRTCHSVGPDRDGQARTGDTRD
jgi:hypothetical protein